MLPPPMLRAKVAGRLVKPAWLEPHDDATQALVGRVFEAFEHAAQKGERLGTALDALEPLRLAQADQALFRGLVRVAQNRCVFDETNASNAKETRRALFLAAGQIPPLALSAGPTGRQTAQTLIEGSANEWGRSPQKIADELYADLPSEQRIKQLRITGPTWLLDRYNVALAQGLLGRAHSVEIRLDKPEPIRVRQLFRWVHFQQLLHETRRDTRGNLHITLDGPASLFGATVRYGRQLARFLPALLLQPGGWRFEATVEWKRARSPKRLVLTPETGLVSHYKDVGAYRTKATQHLLDQMADLQSDWTVLEATEPIRLGPKTLLFPTLVLSNGTTHVDVEICGYWKPEDVARRLDDHTRYGTRPLLLAVNRRLAGAPTTKLDEDARVVAYSELISAKRLFRAVERVRHEQR